MNSLHRVACATLLALAACTGEVSGELPAPQSPLPEPEEPPPFEGVWPEDPRFEPPLSAFVGCGAVAEEDEVLALTNEARAAVGAGALTCDADLARAARLHSWDMCERDFFAHSAPDSVNDPSPYGAQPSDRVSAQGVVGAAVGENIAVGYPTPRAVHTGWMNSPGHRSNIEGRGYRRLGVGLFDCGGRKYWTQNFAN